MCGNIENRKKGAEGEEEPIGEGESNPRYKSIEGVIITAPLVLKISIFFDGTGNNRFNTKAGSKGYKPPVLKGSYENYYSNIALLYLAMEENEWHKKIYIQGAGTAKWQRDMLFGMGVGAGSSGMNARVYEAKRAVEKLLRQTDQNKVYLRLYGFSRGAAFARYFCSYIKQNPITKETNAHAFGRGLVSGLTFGVYTPPPPPKPEVSINFLGLFDTVSSIGTDPYDDVKKYNLDISEKEHGVFNIVHLTAQDDFRGKFPLTSITAAVNEGIGFECSFPGAHSDIGGGYSKVTEEKETYLGYKKEEYLYEDWIYWKWFRDKGYYKDDGNQLKFRRPTGVGLPFYEEVYGIRKTTFHYQFILAEIMQDIMKAKKTSFAKESTLQKDIASMKKITVLNKFRDQAYNYVIGKYKTPGSYSIPLSGIEEKTMKEIYNKYIHNSLDFSTMAISNGGTKDNKKRNKDGSLNFRNPTRPKVTAGFKK